MPQEMLDIINEQDEVVGTVTKREVYDKCLAHRIVQVLVFNSAGEILLQLRSMQKSGYPGYWAPSAGGHVMTGEGYKEAAQRELREELGIETELKPLQKFLFNAKTYEAAMPIQKMIHFFSASHEGPFRFNAGEIEDVKFFDTSDIKRMIAIGRNVHPELVYWVEKFGS